ncbi:MAG: hypothetical protein CMO01_23215 [Thalassobius sp.]|nr:hypothetical protein [Thalassovita sp.]
MEVNYQNLNTYLKDNVSSNACGHVSNKIEHKLFEKIGGLYDDTYGYLSYLSIQSSDDTKVFIGAYPLHNCDVLKCKTCGQVVFFYFNDGGVAPRPAYVLADYSKEYIIDPTVKYVSISKEKLAAFIEAFNLKALKNPDKIPDGYHANVKDYNGRYIFNYREFKSTNNEKVSFDLVAPRDFLRSVHQWIKAYDNDK